MHKLDYQIQPTPNEPVEVEIIGVDGKLCKGK